MKSPLIPWLGVIAAAVVAFAIGRGTAPSSREPAALVVEARRNKSSTPSPAATSESPRVHSRERRESQSPKEHRISLPLSIIAETLKKDLSYLDFSSLTESMDAALSLLAATPREIEEIKDHLATAKARIVEQEKRHLRVVDITPVSFRLDASDMQHPADAVILGLKDGIRGTLPPDEADALLSAIHWEGFYQIKKLSARFDIVRDGSGRLNAHRRYENGSSGHGVGNFKDDGTPIPADQIFDERWKPFLNGLALLPVDEK